MAMTAIAAPIPSTSRLIFSVSQTLAQSRPTLATTVRIATIIALIVPDSSWVLTPSEGGRLPWVIVDLRLEK
jgi:hypothetical protein